MAGPSAIGCRVLPASGAHTKVTVTSKFSKHYEALVVPFFTDYDEEWAERMPHADRLRPMLLAMGATGRYGEVVRIPISEGDDSYFAVAVGEFPRLHCGNGASGLRPDGPVAHRGGYGIHGGF